MWRLILFCLLQEKCIKYSYFFPFFLALMHSTLVLGKSDYNFYKFKFYAMDRVMVKNGNLFIYNEKNWNHLLSLQANIFFFHSLLIFSSASMPVVISTIFCTNVCWLTCKGAIECSATRQNILQFSLSVRQSKLLIIKFKNY